MPTKVLTYWSSLDANNAQVILRIPHEVADDKGLLAHAIVRQVNDDLLAESNYQLVVSLRTIKR